MRAFNFCSHSEETSPGSREVKGLRGVWFEVQLSCRGPDMWLREHCACVRAQHSACIDVAIVVHVMSSFDQDILSSADTRAQTTILSHTQGS